MTANGSAPGVAFFLAAAGEVVKIRQKKRISTCRTNGRLLLPVFVLVFVLFFLEFFVLVFFLIFVEVVVVLVVFVAVGSWFNLERIGAGYRQLSSALIAGKLVALIQFIFIDVKTCVTHRAIDHDLVPSCFCLSEDS